MASAILLRRLRAAVFIGKRATRKDIVAVRIRADLSSDQHVTAIRHCNDRTALVSHPGARKTLLGKDGLPEPLKKELTQGYLFEVDLDYLTPNQDATIEFESTYIDSFQGQSEEWVGRDVRALPRLIGRDPPGFPASA